MKWEILDTGMASAKENMALDSQLLQNCGQAQKPILHFYEWEGDAATFGYFLDPWSVLRQSAALKHGLKLARRPTGGGLVFHLTDFAFSVLVPATHPAYSANTLENYAFVNRIICRALQQYLGGNETPALLQKEAASVHPHAQNFCMAKPTIYDVMWQGKKVGGAAQRRTKSGFLHQGTISLALPPQALLEEVLVDPTVYQAMLSHTFCLADRKAVPAARRALRQCLKEVVS